MIRSIAAGTVMIATVGSAWAHSYVPLQSVVAGERADIPVRISHGCDGAPTNRVTVTVPQGVTNVTVEHNRDWQISVTMRPLPKPIPGEGGVMLTETVDTITWSGNTLPEGRFESFVFRGKMPATPGRLFLPIVQSCERGEHRWVALPRPGEDIGAFMRREPEPAPFIMVVAPPAGAAAR